MATAGDARDRDLWLVAGAIGLSAAGDFIALIALGLRANDMQGDGIGVATIFIALWAPIAVLAGHVGLIVDRFETTRLLLWVSLAQAAVGVALAFTTPFGLLLLLTALLGTGVAADAVGRIRPRPRRLGHEKHPVRQRDRGDGPLHRVRRRAARRRRLTAVGGVEWAMLADSATFVIVAVVAGTLEGSAASGADTRRAAAGT